MIGQFNFKNAKLSTDFKTHTNILTLEIDKDSNYAIKQLLDELKDTEIYTAEFKKSTRKRTLDQNAYMWVLLQRIAEKLNIPKEEVYREIVKDCGQFDILCVTDKALERFIENWSRQGIGWVCDTDTSKIKGCTNVICYYGTSTYTTEEMKRILDTVIEECKEFNINTEVTGYVE